MKPTITEINCCYNCKHCLTKTEFVIVNYKTLYYCYKYHDDIPIQPNNICDKWETKNDKRRDK